MRHKVMCLQLSLFGKSEIKKRWSENKNRGENVTDVEKRVNVQESDKWQVTSEIF